LPQATEPLLRYPRTQAARAAATARDVPAGPVHLNFPFREPLVPLPPDPPAPVGEGPGARSPYVPVAGGPREVDPAFAAWLGARPTSKPVLQYLQQYPACRQVVVDGAPAWNDPSQLAAEFVYADPVALCAAVVGDQGLGIRDQGLGISDLGLGSDTQHATRY